MASLADINVSEGSVATYARCGGIFFIFIQGCICQISLGGSKFWLLKSTTVLMHRYIESRPPVAFFNSSRGVRNFRGGFNPQPPTNTALYSFNYKFTKESSSEKN